MINLKNKTYKPSDIIWYCKVSLSKERRTFLNAQKPKKLTIVSIKPVNTSYGSYTEFICSDEKDKSYRFSIYDLDNPDHYSYYYADNNYLFSSKEEAIHEWNSTINEGIDWLDFQHQENVKFLKSRLIKE